MKVNRRRLLKSTLGATMATTLGGCSAVPSKGPGAETLEAIARTPVLDLRAIKRPVKIASVELLRFGPFEVRRPRSVLAIAGCIPMIPGGAATSWIIGLLELTAQSPVDPAASLQTAVSAGLRVVFTIGAIGAGLTMVRSLVPHAEFP